ncbi:MAG: alginate O-acetyltransferase AlgX-related protein, partial [Candidatus Binatia bacterium]
FEAAAGAPLDRNGPQRRLLRFAGERGIPCIDLLPPLREAGRSEPVYFQVDRHFNRLGHAVAAREILRALQDASLLKGSEDAASR